MDGKQKSSYLTDLCPMAIEFYDPSQRDYRGLLFSPTHTDVRMRILGGTCVLTVPSASVEPSLCILKIGTRKGDSEDLQVCYRHAVFK